MSVGSNPTPGVDFNEQEELLLKMEEERMELKERMELWMERKSEFEMLPHMKQNFIFKQFL